VKNLRWLTLFVLGSLIVALVACGSNDKTTNDSIENDVENNGTVDDFESVTLKYAGVVPETHDLYIYGTKVFIEEVEQLSDGKITIELYPNGQLGSPADMINIANTGVADIVEAAPSYIPGKLALSNVFQLPGALSDAESGSKVIWETLKDENSIVRKTDFDNNGIHPLFAATLPLYQIVTTGKNPISSFDDLKGLKLRSGGGVQDLTVQNLGATPVAMDLSEYYQALERGTLDGGVFNLPAMEANKTIEVLENLTTNANVTSFVIPASISKTVWDELEQPVQDILTEAGETAALSLAENMDSSSEAALDNALEKGFNAWTLSPEELDQLSEMVAPTWDQWVDEMNKLGFDGQQAVDEMNEMLKKFN